ncbi:hypothetical protein HNR46_003330 [Haloferula luteola]|uniref:Uncharacterized protein n=1 Tax=Haloferula luteola TaxID=595692 RepID=A0A840V457_9BACT|nr:hypothetical protein [Haloferula luteola]
MIIFQTDSLDCISLPFAIEILERYPLDSPSGPPKSRQKPSENITKDDFAKTTGAKKEEGPAPLLGEERSGALGGIRVGGTRSSRWGTRLGMCVLELP